MLFIGFIKEAELFDGFYSNSICFSKIKIWLTQIQKNKIYRQKLNKKQVGQKEKNFFNFLAKL